MTVLAERLTASFSVSMMLNVDGGHHVDAGVEQFQNIFVTLAVFAAGHVGMRQLIDDDRIGMPRQNGVDVHLLQFDAAIRNHPEGNDFQVADAGPGLFAAVRLDETDDHVDVLLVRPCGGHR